MADKILNSFDVWIGAQGWKSKLRLKSVDNISLEGVDRLRELILDLAVQGKLVPQDRSDEPADILLEKISRDKKQLISDGKIKKEKLEHIKSATEKLFQIPPTWRFARFSDISYLITDGTHHTPKYVSEGIPFLSVKDMSGGFLDFSQTRFVSEEQHKELIKRCNPQKGDLLLTKVGTTGIPILVETDRPFSIFVSVALIKFPKLLIDGRYLSLSIKSPFVKNQSEEGTEGIGNKNLVLRKIESFTIPLPPLAEQHRIVAKVDELMSLCDELEQQETNHLKSHQLLVETLLGTLTQAKDAAEFQTAWATLAQHFDDLFITEDSIDQLKQTILQLAVMGKLVSQDPKDEPASVLLERIKKDKERLIELGEIKKEKPLPAIQAAEIPFNPPIAWEFARLGEITNKIGSGSTPRGGRESYSNEGILFLRSQNIRDHGLELSDVAFITEETHERMSGTKVYPNDILLNITGGSLGRSTIFPDDAEEANVSQHVTIIRPTNPDTRFFLHMCIVSPYGQELIWGRQVGANREGLSKKVLELFEIPIPPLKEQKRIIRKVNELFALCDSLKERITEAQKVANLMADSILEQV